VCERCGYAGSSPPARFQWPRPEPLFSTGCFARHHGPWRSCCGFRTPTRERSKPEFTATSSMASPGSAWAGTAEPVISEPSSRAHRAAIASCSASGPRHTAGFNERRRNSSRCARAAEGPSTHPPRTTMPNRDLSAGPGRPACRRRPRGGDPFPASTTRPTIGWSDLVAGEDALERQNDLGGDMVIARRAPAADIGDPL